jgi:hypothetical protein
MESTKINPIMEFYEYQIHKYEPLNRFVNFEKEDIVYKFGDIVDSDENSCQRIGIEGAFTDEPDTHRSTCDPITNSEHSGGYKHFTDNKKENPFPIYDIENLYNNYKEFLAKNKVSDMLTSKSIDTILSNLNSAFKKQLEYIYDLVPESHPFKTYLDNYEAETFEKLKNININDSIVMKVNITKQTKIVMFGDFHGSFHTFFRLLCRLHKYDILNLDTFKINDNYKMIFLGDILDRGQYSLDIINIIFKLIAINNTKDDLKIIYNRGNHEVINIFERDGFLQELNSKLEISDKDIFLKQYLHLLNVLPSAIVLNCENNLFWCSHGGFPVRYIKKETDKEYIPFVNLFDNNKLIYLTSDDATHIRWNDFGANSTSNFIESSRGNTIYVFTAQGTNNFLDTNKINFIIRGHQDSKGNSFLFQKNGQINVIGNPNITNKDKFLFYNDKIKAYGTRVDGPIARLKLDKKLANEFNYFPVLTISTNTDARRYLNTDSFALLRFDIPEDTENKFINVLNSINSINRVLQSKHINMSSIFIRNLDIIISMLQLIHNDNFYDYNTFICELNDDTRRKCKDKISIITFISDIFSDCKEFIEYYNQKYENLKEKINEIVNDVKDIQKKYLNDYINNYKIKIDQCKVLLDLITDNISIKFESIKIKKDQILSINNITEKINIIRESEIVKKSNLQKLKQDKTLEQIEAELKTKVLLLKSE